jgi:hypothetical protein
LKASRYRWIKCQQWSYDAGYIEQEAWSEVEGETRGEEGRCGEKYMQCGSSGMMDKRWAGSEREEKEDKRMSQS